MDFVWFMYLLSYPPFGHPKPQKVLFTLRPGEGLNSEGDIITCTFLPARVHPAWCFLHGIPVSDGEILGIYRNFRMVFVGKKMLCDWVSDVILFFFWGG